METAEGERYLRKRVQVLRKLGRCRKWSGGLRRPGRVRKSKYGKQKQARRVGRVWKSAEDGGSQIGSVRRVGRVLGEARTPRKGRPGSEETRRPAEDKA